MDSSDPPRSTWLEVDLDQLGRNIEKILSQLDDSELFAVVKADAYGHGDYQVSKVALEKGAKGLAVATVDEGVRLRKAGMKSPPILVMGGIYLSSEIRKVVEHDLQQAVNSKELVEKISDYSKEVGKVTPLHINVETGMGRLGAFMEKSLNIAEHIEELDNVELKGVMTHFSVADSDDKSYTYSQLNRFKRFLKELKRRGFDPEVVHAANSAGTIDVPESHFDIVRVGLAMYGMYPSPSVRKIDIKPIATWKTKIVFEDVMEEEIDISYGRLYTAEEGEKIAILPVGYGDGYSRAMTGKADVLINGKRFPVVGAICMDSSAVSVDDSCEMGDEVVLMGDQEGGMISPEELADWRGTINYEVVTTIGSRVPRCYIKDGEVSDVEYPRSF